MKINNGASAGLVDKLLEGEMYFKPTTIVISLLAISAIYVSGMLFGDNLIRMALLYFSAPFLSIALLFSIKPSPSFWRSLLFVLITIPVHLAAVWATLYCLEITGSRLSFLAGGTAGAALYVALVKIILEFNEIGARSAVVVILAGLVASALSVFLSYFEIVKPVWRILSTLTWWYFVTGALYFITARTMPSNKRLWRQCP